MTRVLPGIWRERKISEPYHVPCNLSFIWIDLVSHLTVFNYYLCVGSVCSQLNLKLIDIDECMTGAERIGERVRETAK